MNSRKLDPGELPGEERRGRRERHLLALTGGGYRGLFSAEILAAAEADGGVPLGKRFDMIAGTSVGGILAIGLASGVPARDLVAFMREHGPAIFQPSPLSFAGFSKSRYGNGGLQRAIEAVLGKPRAQRAFADIPVPLVVSAVQEGTGTPYLFRSSAAATGKGDEVSTLDVALATSAAPTYFPPHRIGDRVYVDGGLVANAPDLVVLTEAARQFGCRLEECHLLSIGTAGSPRAGTVDGAPGKIGWLARHAIIDLIMTAQEALAINQVRCLRPGTFLRIDAKPAQRIELDDTSTVATKTIIELAQKAIENTRQTQAAEWRRFLAYLA
ncbi:CBASS cGAMP-activated phospholipase [Methylocystis sp.]|uniref:CBASS cGAMP-activated phospholipase n=1 Tax=Methylocystis sp. TaxID=1911079 RepID=UPI0025F6FCAA|nr:CBASS cGAMP-activated phospholipase [Methylocystis sp.]